MPTHTHLICDISESCVQIRRELQLFWRFWGIIQDSLVLWVLVYDESGMPGSSGDHLVLMKREWEVIPRFPPSPPLFLFPHSLTRSLCLSLWGRASYWEHLPISADVLDEVKTGSSVYSADANKCYCRQRTRLLEPEHWVTGAAAINRFLTKAAHSKNIAVSLSTRRPAETTEKQFQAPVFSLVTQGKVGSHENLAEISFQVYVVTFAKKKDRPSLVEWTEHKQPV